MAFRAKIRSFIEDAILFGAGLSSNRVRLKNNSGVLEARNDTDAAYIIGRGADPVGNDDWVTKRFFDANTKIQATSGEAISAGAPVSFNNSGGSPRVFRSDADGAAQLQNCLGLLVAAAGAAGVAVLVQQTGEMSVADAIWDVVPAVTDVGSRVYVSTNVGKLTLTAPTTTGAYVLKVGIVTQGGAGTVKIGIQIGEGTLIL